MEGKFILQIVGITEALIKQCPSSYFPENKQSAEAYIISEDKTVLTNIPFSGGSDMIVDATTNASVLVAYCPEDHADADASNNTICNNTISNNTIVNLHTHTVFLSIQRDTISLGGGKYEEHEQIIGINPKIAYEIMESAIEKNLISALPPVKQFKRNVEMRLEGKIDSCFSFVGICEDDVPFIMEVFNVPFAEHSNESNITRGAEEVVNESEEEEYNTKIAYYPAKNTDNTQAIQRIKDLTTIKSESIIRCLLGYVVERTDVDCFNFSTHDAAYRAAVKNAIENGVDIVPLMVSWTKEGIAFFVTDKLPVVYPQ